MDPITTAVAVAGYACSSSLLSIVNKFAVTVFPFPAFLTAIQYLACCLATLLFGRMGIIEHERLEFRKAIAFLPAAATFYVAIWTNTQLLRHANVETFIVFRSCTPLLVAVADSFFVRRPWPAPETWLSLLAILGGAITYALFDNAFSVTAYSWAFAYLFCITFEMVFIKQVVMNAGLSTWGLVLYNNLLALLFVPPSLIVMNEPGRLLEYGPSNALSPRVTIPIILSCAFGLSISYFGFLCRKAVSATSYTVIGVTNKFLTILVNLLIWDKHASPSGLGALLVCILGGVAYQHSVTSLPSPKIQIQPADLESIETVEEKFHELELNEKAMLLAQTGGGSDKQPARATPPAHAEE